MLSLYKTLFNDHSGSIEKHPDQEGEREVEIHPHTSINLSRIPTNKGVKSKSMNQCMKMSTPTLL